MKKQVTFIDSNEREVYNIRSKRIISGNGSCTVTNSRVYFTGKHYYLDGTEWKRSKVNSVVDIKDVGQANKIKWTSAKAWHVIVVVFLIFILGFLFYNACKAQDKYDLMKEKSEITAENVLEHVVDGKSAFEYEEEAEKYYEISQNYMIAFIIALFTFFVVCFAILISIKNLKLLKVSSSGYAYAIPVSGIKKENIEYLNRILLQTKDMYMKQYIYPNMMYGEQNYQQANLGNNIMYGQPNYQQVNLGNNMMYGQPNYQQANLGNDMMYGQSNYQQVNLGNNITNEQQNYHQPNSDNMMYEHQNCQQTNSEVDA